MKIIKLNLYLHRTSFPLHVLLPRWVWHCLHWNILLLFYYHIILSSVPAFAHSLISIGVIFTTISYCYSYIIPILESQLCTWTAVDCLGVLRPPSTTLSRLLELLLGSIYQKISKNSTVNFYHKLLSAIKDKLKLELKYVKCSIGRSWWLRYKR